jgi:MFS-type transporter involved in bile tolerance (Atg22 family)
MYYKSAMVVGVIFGMIFDFVNRKLRISELLVLVLQTVAFLALNAAVFFCICFDAPYAVVLILSLVIGFLYSWNTSLARGFFSKLVPANKKAELMGLYSSMTYLGISIVSGLNLILRSDAIKPLLAKPSAVLFAAVFFWTLPSFLFFALLLRALRKGK